MTARRRRLGLAAVAFAGVLCFAVAAPSSTEAAWTDTEVSSATFAAGEVLPATGLTCEGGLLQRGTFRWTAPVGGLTRTKYRWTVTVNGTTVGSGDLPADTTQVSPPMNGLIVLGEGTFSLYSVGESGWESKSPATHTVFVVSVVLIGVVAACAG